jgi:predicted transposase YbfD/YdcC
MTSPVRRLIENLPDPRAANARHRLGDLIFISVSASLCGAESCVDFEQFARSKQALLTRVLGPFSPPSHDTFSRVFRRLDASAFARAFAAFMTEFAAAVGGVVAVDGKALRRAYEAGMAAAPPLMVNVWAAQARLALAGVMVDGEAVGNEVEAALKALAMLDLSGATVTADALHCHRRMAAQVRAQGGDFALCVKGNRPKLKRAAEALLAAAPNAPVAETEEIAHGRAEKRRARVAPAPRFAAEHDFPGVAAIAEIVSQRGRAAPHRRLFLLSRIMTAHEALATVRQHWQIENRLHWSLDVVFGEDAARSRKDHAPANLALIRRIALNAINAIDDPKTSKRRRLKRCAWEDQYLLDALAQMR